MLTRKRLTLIKLIISILIISITFSGCTLLRGNPFEDLGDDYLYWEWIGLDGRTLRINKSGYAEYTELGSQWLGEYRTGKLSENDMEELSDYIENSGFFRLGGYYPRLLNVMVESIAGISVSRDGKVKSVYEYGISAPKAFYDVEDYLFDVIIPKLQHSSKYGTFIEVENISKIRSIAGEEIKIDKEDLKSNLFLKEAIENPCWLIHINSSELGELENYIIENKDEGKFGLIFEDKKYRLDIFERDE